MAGNVCDNIRCFNIECDLITNKNLITKTRYVDESCNYILLRVDENDFAEKIDPSTIKSIDFSIYDAVIISDYNKGFLSTKNILEISKLHSTTFLDTKKYLAEWCKDIKYIKLNNSEYEKNLNFISKNNKISNKIIKTKGRHGCEFNNQIYKTEDVAIKDVSGAGDTFISCLVADYCKTKNIESSINFAQECTTKVVQKQGVSTPQ